MILHRHSEKFSSSVALVPRRLSVFFCQLSTLAIFPYLSFLCFNLGMIVLWLCDIIDLEFWYDKGNGSSHCQICHFCVVG